MNINEMDDPYVQFVLLMTAECADAFPEGERVFAAFFIGWLRCALDRAITE